MIIAVDFGAGSGRVMGAEITPDGTMHVTELHRFANRRVKLGHHTYWDFPSLFAEMLTGIRKAVDSGHHIQSIAIDTWGVDFGLIDDAGCLLGLPLCYRDPSTAGFPGRRAAIISDSEHYSSAGIQIMEINSIYRLMAMADEQPHMLDAASSLLFMPDLFSYFLTGEANVEYSIASTSELLDARTRTWNMELIRSLGLPERIFGPIVMPGTVRGHLTDDVRRQLGIDYDVPVIAVGSHDTASAVYASAAALSPADTAYLSSGTWSLLGVLLDSPNLSEQARSAGFTNEGGVGGKIRFLQNITGLWILQRLVEQWQQQGMIHDYPALIAEAEKPESETDARIDPDDTAFANPADMERAIAEYCSAHGMTPPATQGQTVRLVLESLAARYAKGLRALNELIGGNAIKRLNIIGGGSLNTLLNRLTARAAGIEVIAGPVEATAIGSILLQAETIGAIGSRSEVTNAEFH